MEGYRIFKKTFLFSSFLLLYKGKNCEGGEGVKLAVVGSRSLKIENLSDYIPEGVTEIVSGGAQGVDASARQWAEANGIPVTEFLPDYDRYGRSAPILRNKEIAAYCDGMLAFWDGKSRGTGHAVKACRALGKPVRILRLKTDTGSAYQLTLY